MVFDKVIFDNASDPKMNLINANLRTQYQYLVWKIEYNAIKMPSKIFLRRVAADGISFRESW